ncbi:MAG TPA: hypothetical protein PKL31_01995 [Fulvivirga sp.]|nr:hypothetical protein [Fulvivirga sp.]
MAFHFDGYSQEHYGKTLNMGVGVAGYSGYYRYAGKTIPVFNINYEIDVVKNLTLAPFASIYAFKDDYYWGNNNNPDRYYTYSEVVVPIGIKSYYYFDDLINATSDWDIYAGASLGFAIVNSTWDTGYQGNKNHFNKGSQVFLDVHVGATYHFNKRMGAYLDLSSGVSTIGLQFNGK